MSGDLPGPMRPRASTTSVLGWPTEDAVLEYPESARRTGKVTWKTGDPALIAILTRYHHDSSKRIFSNLGSFPIIVYSLEL